MANSPIGAVIQQLRRLSFTSDEAGLTDGQLLGAFVDQGDETAFEALLRRHGPMVLGVCRRLLHNPHDSEDAFQATFLVLVRKAASIAPRHFVAHWLYGVACKVALEARRAAARRRVREAQAHELPEGAAPQLQDTWQDLRPILDQELSRLPEKYRLPIILCYLEDRSIKEAARHLGWPQGTVAGRLARGRELLARRLARHAFLIPAGALAAVISQNVARALPIALAVATLRAARVILAGGATTGFGSANVMGLVEGALKAMLLKKLKMVTALLLLVATGSWAGGLITERISASQGDRQEGQAGKGLETHASKSATEQTDLEKLQGDWSMVRIEGAGLALPGFGIMRIQGNRLLSQVGGSGEFQWQGSTFRLDASKNPKQITVFCQEPDGPRQCNGIYALAGDQLRICVNEKDNDTRPNGFITKEGLPLALLVFQRLRPVRPAEGAEGNEVDRKLRQAFGQESEVVNYKIKLLMRGQGTVLAANNTNVERGAVLVLAANDVVIEPDGRVRMRPFRLASFFDDRGLGTSTISADAALLTFDSPIRQFTNLANHKLRTMKLLGNADVDARGFWTDWKSVLQRATR